MSSEDDIEVRLSRAAASPDGVHWYEKPDGMPMAEFLASLR